MFAMVGKQAPQPVRDKNSLVSKSLVNSFSSRPVPATLSSSCRPPGLPRIRPCSVSLSESRPCGPSKPANCLPTVSAWVSIPSSMTAAVSMGMMPTIDRYLTGTAVPSGVSSRS